MPGELEYEELVEEASAPQTTPERLQTLARRGGAIAVAVAQNPNTPRSVLEAFCQGNDLLLIFGVIANRNTPELLLSSLGAHRDRGIRRAIAACSRTPKGLRVQLEEDRDRQVSNAAFWSLAKAPEELKATGDLRRLYRLAMHRQAPIAQLTALSWELTGWVRDTIARNKSTPAEALSFLADDPAVRRVALTNPNTSRETLARYMTDPNPGIRRAIANNPISSREMLTTLLQDPSALVRRAAARNLNLLATQLERTALNDPDLRVRAAAVRSMRTRVKRNRQLRRIQRLGLGIGELWSMGYRPL